MSRPGFTRAATATTLTNSWKHILPHPERLANLTRIAQLLHQFDLVGLQEVDAGSLRSAYIDQIQYLARHGAFPHWYRQVNRNLGPFAQHSNGLLSRLRPQRITEHKLPGLPGRGAVVAELGLSDRETLAVAIVHLALGWRARRRQLDYLVALSEQHPYLVIMGDFNCGCDSKGLRAMVRKTRDARSRLRAEDLPELAPDAQSRSYPGLSAAPGHHRARGRLRLVRSPPDQHDDRIARRRLLLGTPGRTRRLAEHSPGRSINPARRSSATRTRSHARADRIGHLSAPPRPERSPRPERADAQTRPAASNPKTASDGPGRNSGKPPRRSDGPAQARAPLARKATANRSSAHGKPDNAAHLYCGRDTSADVPMPAEPRRDKRGRRPADRSAIATAQPTKASSAENSGPTR